jgi:hypothetical protein
MTVKCVVRAAWVLCLIASSLGCNSNEGAPTAKQSAAKEPSNSNSSKASDSAIVVIDAAIAAHGVAESSDKTNAGRVTMEIDGNFVAGISGHGIVTDTFQLPDKLKRLATIAAKDQKVGACFVFNGEKAWVQKDGKEPSELPTAGNPINQPVLANIEMLLSFKNGELSLKLLPEEEIGGRRFDIVRVEANGQRISDLYFDKTTHLLAASKKILPDLTTQKSLAVETNYSEYKVIDGLNIPMLIEATVDGKQHLKVKVLEIEFLESIPPETFNKPTAK